MSWMRFSSISKRFGAFILGVGEDIGEPEKREMMKSPRRPLP
jgi:hypothetical protein